MAEQAIPYASEIAQACDAMVVVYRGIPYPSMAGSEAEALFADVSSEAREYLDCVSPRLMGHARPRVVEGTPAETILRLSEEESVDLIVMTTHGRRGLSRFLMGSVAYRVVCGSGKPVLLIRSRVLEERRGDGKNGISQSKKTPIRA